MPHKPNLAEIVQEASFSEKLDKFSVLYPRMDEVHRGIDWLLTRVPLQGNITSGEYRIIKTTPLGEIPSFWVLYKYNKEDNQVFLVSLEALSNQPD